VIFNKHYLCDLIDKPDKRHMTSHVTSAEFKLYYGDSRQSLRFRIVRRLCNDSRTVYFHRHLCLATMAQSPDTRGNMSNIESYVTFASPCTCERRGGVFSYLTTLLHNVELNRKIVMTSSAHKSLRQAVVDYFRVRPLNP
jgi:hypothetical protein